MVRSVAWKNLTQNPVLSDYFVIIFFPAVVAWHYYGGNAVRLMLVCLLCSAALELLFAYVLPRYALKKQSTPDFPLAIYMGLCTALLLPASAPLWFPVPGLVFGFALGSLAPQFLSRSVLLPTKFRVMPAAAAVSFLSLFRRTMFAYSPFVAGDTQESQIPLPSLGSLLRGGILPPEGTYTRDDIFTGAVTGAIGATCVVVLLASLVFLLLRNKESILAPGTFLATAALWAFILPRASFGRLRSVGYELSAGMLLFAAVFLLSFPRYLPRARHKQAIYGAICAVLTMLLRRAGFWEETVCLALLLMQLTLPLWDYRRTGLPRKAGKDLPTGTPTLHIPPPHERTQEEILDDMANDNRD